MCAVCGVYCVYCVYCVCCVFARSKFEVLTWLGVYVRCGLQDMVFRKRIDPASIVSAGKS